MKATIGRGVLQQNSIARRHVRIIRTLDPSALELSHAMASKRSHKIRSCQLTTYQSVENVWTGKIDYSLSTPTKGVIFGTTISVDFRLIPLLKGLKIGRIRTQLNETQEMTIEDPKQPRRRKITRTVVQDVYTLPENAETAEIAGREGYLFSRPLVIPKNLRQCVQTVDTMGIRTKHTLGFNVQLHNPDGHVSEVSVPCPHQQ